MSADEICLFVGRIVCAVGVLAAVLATCGALLVAGVSLIWRGASRIAFWRQVKRLGMNALNVKLRKMYDQRVPAPWWLPR